jgi:hypothetical protein
MLSTSAFKFNLRRYSTAESGGAVAEKCASDDFGDGNAACPDFILDDSSVLTDNRASLSGAAVHWLTKVRRCRFKPMFASTG